MYDEQKKKLISNGICDLTNTDKKCKLYYEIYGTGQHHILILEGMVGSIDDLKRQMLFLLENIDCTICVYDHRGVRFSESFWKTYSINLMARDAYALINFLQWEKVSLIGYSMGAMISLEFACLYPQVIESIVLIGGTTGITQRSFKTTWTFMRAMMISDTQKRNKVVGPCLFSPSFLNESHIHLNNMTGMAYITQPVNMNPFADTRILKSTVLGQIFACNNYKLKSERMISQICNNNIPVLLLHGTLDNMVLVKCSENIKNILGDKCTLICVEGGGHFLPLEHPQLLNESIMNFLIENGVRKKEKVQNSVISSDEEENLDLENDKKKK